MKILYTPLDERPCNYSYPLRAAGLQDNLVVAPPLDLLGQKKQAADVQKLRAFVDAHVKNCQYAVLSTELLLYGGLIPSRLHHLTQHDAEEYIAWLKRLKNKYPHLQLFLSSMIMRTPKYSSSEEEPDYYQEYGKQIFELGVALDHQQHEHSSSMASVSTLRNAIPSNIIKDFEERRAFNAAVTRNLIRLVQDHTIDFMVIPQDDSHPYGYTAMDQRTIYPLVREFNLSNKILIYPGADEVGYELLARAVNHYRQHVPNVYVMYSSVNGPTIVPAYEDREVGESLKSHLLVCGAQLVDDVSRASFVLAYNVPGHTMIEAADQLNERELSYDRNRNVVYFAQQIIALQSAGYDVAVCDAAFANGGDVQLFQLLAKTPGAISKLLSYRGWNTNCNSLGSTLATAMFSDSTNTIEHEEVLLSGIFDDIFYQAMIRPEFMQAEADHSPTALGISRFDLFDRAEIVSSFVKARCLDLFGEYLPSLAQSNRVSIALSFPWNRVFEVDCQVHLRPQKE